MGLDEVMRQRFRNFYNYFKKCFKIYYEILYKQNTRCRHRRMYSYYYTLLMVENKTIYCRIFNVHGFLVIGR